MLLNLIAEQIQFQFIRFGWLVGYEARKVRLYSHYGPLGSSVAIEHLKGSVLALIEMR